MNMLTLIRNPHAVQRLARIKSRRWDATRSLPMDNTARSRAQSLLIGMLFLDGSNTPGTLTTAQAQDVLRWAADARIL